MALNQTQRDHAIKMIEKAISEKKSQFVITNPSEMDFITKHIQDGDIDLVPVTDILEAATADRWRNRDCNLLDIFKVRFAYEAECKKNKETYELSTAKLTALEFDLKGKIMFGNDFSVINEALEQIANFN